VHEQHSTLAGITSHLYSLKQVSSSLCECLFFSFFGRVCFCACAGVMGHLYSVKQVSPCNTHCNTPQHTGTNCNTTRVASDHMHADLVKQVSPCNTRCNTLCNAPQHTTQHTTTRRNTTGVASDCMHANHCIYSVKSVPATRTATYTATHRNTLQLTATQVVSPLTACQRRLNYRSLV